jgi:hypothetical protein
VNARLFSYSGYDLYRPGGGYFLCDVCSQRFRRTQMLVRWDNLRVDQKCNDPRPPLMSVPNVYPEGIPFPDARSPQDRPDRLTDDTALQSISGGMAAPFGQTYPNGQNGQPGALSPLPFLESIDTEGAPYTPEPGNPTVGTPIGPNILADDVTFITGPVSAPDNTDSDVPDPVPAPSP